MSDYKPDWHPDDDVRKAGIAFLDALCTHERFTGTASTLVFRDEKGCVLRAYDGKPGLPSELTDFRALSRYTGREQMTTEEILHSGFEAIARSIDEAPMTWLPGFLIYAVEAGVRRGVFVPGGAAELAAQAEERGVRRGAQPQ